MEPGGGLQRVALAHADPDKRRLAGGLHDRYPPDLATEEGLAAVLRTGESLLVSEITEEMLAGGALDREHLRLLSELGMRSGMLVPLQVLERTIGVLTLRQLRQPAELRRGRPGVRRGARAAGRDRGAQRPPVSRPPGWLGILLGAMVPRRDRLVLLSLALLMAAWMVAETLTGSHTGLLYLAPALTIAVPLILGRYVGEEQLAGLAGRAQSRPRRRVAPVARPRSCVRVMERGGRLVASGWPAPAARGGAAVPYRRLTIPQTSHPKDFP